MCYISSNYGGVQYSGKVKPLTEFFWWDLNTTYLDRTTGINKDIFWWCPISAGGCYRAYRISPNTWLITPGLFVCAQTSVLTWWPLKSALSMPNCSSVSTLTSESEQKINWLCPILTYKQQKSNLSLDSCQSVTLIWFPQITSGGKG